MFLLFETNIFIAEFLKLKSRVGDKSAFKGLPIEEFWAELNEQDYQTLNKLGIYEFAILRSAYMCESSFSYMNGIKTNVRNKLTDVICSIALRSL